MVSVLETRFRLASAHARVSDRWQRFRSRLRERHTLRSHAWQSLANYAQQGFGLIFGVIMARLVTPSDFGAFGFAAASVFLALLPATWSLNPNLLADAGRTPNLFQTTASFGWCVVLVRLGIVASLCLWFFVHGQSETAILCFGVGLAESWREMNNVQRAYLESLGNFKPNLFSAIAGIVFCVLVVVPVSLLGGGAYTLVLPLLGLSFTDHFILRYFSRQNILVKPKFHLTGEMIQKGFWLWLNSASEVTLSRLDSWFIGRFGGNHALGDYNRAFGYAPISHLLLSSLLGNPTLVGFSRCQSADARRRLFLRTGAIVVAGGIVNWAALYFFARPITLFVFGQKWESAVVVFEAFSGLSLAYAVALLPVALLLSARKYRELALVRMSCVVFFVVAIILFPATRSVQSMAYLVQATWVLQGVSLLFLCRSLLTEYSTGDSLNA